MMDEPDILSDLDQLRSRYHVLRQLGQDGGCPVYAVRGRDSDRHYVVKVMAKPGSGTAQAGTLHLWQAHTMERLDHPNLLVLHAVHHLQGGTLALAMERRRGRTLAERIEDGGPLPIAEVERVLREVAGALAYLHRRGVVHRGVGTDSILLDEDTRSARLAHYGIHRSDAGRGAVPDGASVLRARAYLAPEQLSGGGPEGRDPSPRTDLYSLGRVGYAMLTGREPWAGAGAGDPSPASLDEPLETLRADAPAALRRAIEGCLERDPRRRWRSVEEFLARLDSAAEPDRTAPRIDLSALRARAAAAVAAVRTALPGRMAAATPRSLALALATAVVALAAWGVLRGSDAPVSSSPADRPETSGAAASRGSSGLLRAEGPSPAGGPLPGERVDPVSDRFAEPTHWSAIVVGERSADATPPSSPLRAPAPRGTPRRAPRRAGEAAAPGGLVLLGDPVGRAPAPTLLGDPVAPRDRRR